MPGPFFSPSFGLPNKCRADDADDVELETEVREEVAKEGENADP
jgi:hypothetical protein